MSTQSRFALVLLATTLARPTVAEDWPQFGRNQSRNAVSPEKNPPLWWQFEKRDNDEKVVKENKNIRWAAKLHSADGYGQIYGDPVIVDGLVWVGSSDFARDKKDNLVIGSALVCLDEKTGKELYRRVDKRLESNGIREAGRYSSHGSSPLIEGERLWVATNRGEVACLDIAPLKKRQGEPREVWKIDMRKEWGVFSRASLFQNRRCSVAGYKEWIYVVTGHGTRWDHDNNKLVVDDAPSLVCLNKTTGKVVWKDSSPGKNILDGQFASPTVIEVGGKVQVVAPQGDGWVRSFDAATGKLVWQFDTNPHDAKGDATDPDNSTRNDLPATAVFYENRLYIGNGQELEHYSGVAWLYCIDPTKTGDISPGFTSGEKKGKPNPNSGMVWKYGGVDKDATADKFRSDNVFDRTLSNVAIDKGLLIATDVAGTVHCLDAKTGQMHWKHRSKASSNIYGSPLIVDGKVYVSTAWSGYWIFALAKEKKLLGRIGDEGGSHCSPVFANGVLYVATSDALYAVAGNEKKPEK